MSVPKHLSNLTPQHRFTKVSCNTVEPIEGVNRGLWITLGIISLLSALLWTMKCFTEFSHREQAYYAYLARKVIVDFKNLSVPLAMHRLDFPGLWRELRSGKVTLAELGSDIGWIVGWKLRRSWQFCVLFVLVLFMFYCGVDGHDLFGSHNREGVLIALGLLIFQYQHLDFESRLLGLSTYLENNQDKLTKARASC